MPLITKPMLAETLPIDVEPRFGSGIGATPKVDGIRAVMVGGKLLTRTLKAVPNRAIREALEAVLPKGADGEVLAGTSFQECTSMVMSADKVPAPGTVRYFMFDYVKSSADAPYSARMADMEEWWKKRRPSLVEVRILLPTLLKDGAQLGEYEATCLATGYEGVTLRRMDGRYKAGRSTLREGLLLKLKRFTDAEAVIVGFEELVSTTGGGAMGTLGALVVETVDGQKVVFKIGTGFSAAQRADLWRRRHDLVRDGQLVKYKYFEVGVKTAPRFPVFLGLRHADDR